MQCTPDVADGGALGGPVIPQVPVRGWVRVCQFRLPIPLRVLLAAQPELVTPVLQVVQRVVERHLLDHQEPKSDEGQGGAVTLIQRFGSIANLNIHLHCLVLDGVYRCGADAKPAFVEADAPIDDEVHAQLQTLIARLMRMLTRGACWSRTWASPAGRAGCRRRGGAHTAAAAGGSHHLPHRLRTPRGQKVLTLRGAMPRETAVRQPMCADISGFSPHAAVRVWKLNVSVPSCFLAKDGTP